jgi:hypothetical protein
MRSHGLILFVSALTSVASVNVFEDEFAQFETTEETNRDDLSPGELFETSTDYDLTTKNSFTRSRFHF